MAARRRRQPPSLRSTLVFTGGLALGVLFGASFESPRLWLLRLRVPVETVDLDVSRGAAEAVEQVSAAAAPLAHALEPASGRAPAPAGVEGSHAAVRSAMERRIEALPTDELPRAFVTSASAPAAPVLPEPRPRPAAPPAARAARSSAASAARRSAGVVATPVPVPPRAPRAGAVSRRPADRRVVQVAATPRRESARELIAELREQGFDVYLAQRRGLQLIRIRPARDETAERTASRLRRLGHDAQILSE